MKATKVFLREKKISNGRKSLYLDFYPAIIHPDTGKSTRREFLGMYVHAKPRTPDETQHNKETRAIGEKIRATRQLEIQKGIFGSTPDHKKKTDFLEYFRELTDKKYTSEGNYGNWLSTFRQLEACWPDGITFGELNLDKAEHFRDYLLSTDLAQNTKAAYFAKFKAALKQAFIDNYLAEDIGRKIKSIKQAETKREFVSLEELKKLVETDCEKPELKTAFIFSALTGIRYSDIYSLTWQQLYQNHKGEFFIQFTQKKTKGVENHPIPNPARELMGEPGESQERVFPDLKKKLNVWDNLRLKQWFLAAGITKDLTFHCARHSFATIQLTLGTDIYTLSKLLGHKELRTTQIYGKIVDSKKQEAINRLNDFEI